MTTVASFFEFDEFVKSKNSSFSLVCNNENPNSNYAMSDLKEIVSQKNQSIITDVNQEHDIHSYFNISTVPTLLEFEMGIQKNVEEACQDKAFCSTIFKMQLPMLMVRSIGQQGVP